MANLIKTLILLNSLILPQHLIPKTNMDSNGDINSIDYYRVIGNKIKLVKKEEYYYNGQK